MSDTTIAANRPPGTHQRLARSHTHEAVYRAAKPRPTSMTQTPRAEGCTAAISALVADAVAIAPKNQSTFGVSKRGSRSSVAGGGRSCSLMGRDDGNRGGRRPGTSAHDAL